jgi:excisionase family DNA binding protein
MNKQISENFETITPSEADARLAFESRRHLETYKIPKRSSVRIKVLTKGGKPETVSIPGSALHLLLHMLNEMSQGNAVTLVPSHAEITTQQAANMLNVSRPYLVKLLDEGKIPCRTVGKYRRLRFNDLMAYKRKDDKVRAKILDRLTAEAQKLGMGY